MAMRRELVVAVTGVVIALPAIVAAGASGQTLDFRVVDKQTKAPIAGVELAIRVGPQSKKLTTDERGQCRIEYGPQKPDYISVTAIKQGLVPIRVFWGGPNQPTVIPSEYRLAMEPGTSIGGIIQNEEGKPVAGVTLTLVIVSDNAQDSIEHVAIGDLPIKTDAQGRWRCDAMPSELDRVMVRLSHPDYAGDEPYGIRTSPPMDQLRALTSVLVLKKGVPVTGRVLDANDRPIQQATVGQGEMRLGSGYPTTKTDKEGRFEFKAVRPEQIVLTVQAKGYCPDLKEIVAGKDMPPIVFKLERGHTLRGRVVDKAGNAVAGVTVSADGWRGNRSLDWRMDTDPNGRFRWDDAPADEVRFSLGKLHYMHIFQYALTASDQENTITLNSELKIKGRVTDEATGQPVAKFTVCPGIDSGGGRPISWLRREAKSLTGGTYEFAFTQSYPGHAISVEADGYLPQVSRSFYDGEGEVVCDVALKKGAGLSGRVHLPDGQPAVGAKVIVGTSSQPAVIINGQTRPFSDSLSVQTGSDGRFSLPTQTNPYRLVVLHEQGCAQASAEEMDRSSDVTLQAWGRVEGTVLIGTKPDANESIRIAAEAGSWKGVPPVEFQCSAMTDKEGHFAMDRVPPGKVRVSREITMSQTATSRMTMFSNDVTVEVRPGETVNATIGGTGRPVIGKVAIPEAMKEKMAGQKLLGYVGSRSSGSGGRMFALKMEQDGVFRADDIPAGDYTLYCGTFMPVMAARTPTGEPVGIVKYPFTVPEMPGGRSDEPLDLGVLDMRTPEGSIATSSLMGKRLPDLQKLQLTLSPADVNDKRLLVCFFDMQQRPSRNAVSQLARQAGQFKQKGIVALIVQASDADDAALKTWLKDANIPFPVGTIRSDEERTRAAWGVRALPWLVLTDEDHAVRAEGFDMEELSKRIDSK